MPQALHTLSHLLTPPHRPLNTSLLLAEHETEPKCQRHLGCHQVSTRRRAGIFLVLNSCLDGEVQLLLRQLQGSGCYHLHLQGEELTLPRSGTGWVVGFMSRLWDSAFIPGRGEFLPSAPRICEHGVANECITAPRKKTNLHCFCIKKQRSNWKGRKENVAFGAFQSPE